MVFGARVVEAVADGVDGPRPTGAMRAAVDDGAGAGVIGGRRLSWELPEPGALPADLSVGAIDLVAERDRFQRAMTVGAGVLRDAASLARTDLAVARARAVAEAGDAEPGAWELANLAVVAGALVAAATAREESRGAHTRADFPEPAPDLACRLVVGQP
jgi:L-aspartate oxidase